MDELKEKIGELEEKVDSIRHIFYPAHSGYNQKIFLWTAIISLALFILPLLALILILPQFISTYNGLAQ